MHCDYRFHSSMARDGASGVWPDDLFGLSRRSDKWLINSRSIIIGMLVLVEHAVELAHPCSSTQKVFLVLAHPCSSTKKLFLALARGCASTKKLFFVLVRGWATIKNLFLDLAQGWTSIFYMVNHLPKGLS